MTETESLDYITMDFLLGAHLFICFHPFGKNGHIQLMPHLDHGLQYGCANGCRHMIHQTFIQLDPVDGVFLQIIKRCKTFAKVIQGNSDAIFFQRNDILPNLGGISDRNAFRDLQNQQFSWKCKSIHNLLYLLDKIRCRKGITGEITGNEKGIYTFFQKTL